MKKKFSITLLVAMFSLFIIGFGGASKVEAVGECAETQLVNGANESAAFTNCRAFEADAARWNAWATSFTNETNNVQRAFQADAARYSAMAAFYTNETNVPRSLEAEAARYTGLATFYGADGSMTSQPVPVDIEARNFNHYDNLWTASRYGTSPTAVGFVVIESRQNLGLYPNYGNSGRLGH